MKTENCCHTWDLISYGSKEITLGCRLCLKRKTREPTEKELHTLYEGKTFSKYMFGKKGEPSVHDVWHDFRKRFMNDLTFKYKGYELMQKVTRWAKKYPADVQIVGVDDNHFCGSDLVLIDSKTRDTYMGTSVVYIPQCSGEDPIQFFLYPSHREALLAALTTIKKAALPVQQTEKRNARERAKKLRKLFRKG